MLTIRWIRGSTSRRIEAAELAGALDGSDGWVWIDLSAPTAEEETILDHPALGLTELVKEDVREDVHLPKIDLAPPHLLLVVHAIELERSMVELSTTELDIVIAADHLITFHRTPVHAVDEAARVVDAGLADVERPARVVHRILDVMDDVFVPFLDLLGQRLDLVEEDVLNAPTLATRDEIFALRRDLITLRRITVPQAEVIRQLGREQIATLGAADRGYFRDVYDHIHRMAEISEVYRQLVDSAYDMYRSVREDETNRRLTVLTMVSTLLLPITTVAGIYGMNFVHMPELEQRWAYPAVWGVFGAIIVAGLLLFRAWGWIGRAADEEVIARRRGLAETLEIPILGEVLKVPAYGARFAFRGGRRVVGAGTRLLGRTVGRGRGRQRS